MSYESVLYSRSRIEKAGKIIAKYSDDTPEYNEFIPVVDNWRAAHALPLDAITAIINDCMIEKTSINVVQRLKRLDSIIGKLQRANNTGLYRMQDLGGCRIIIPDIDGIYNTINIIKNALTKHGHEVVKEDDYLVKPREISGYRSYHMVVKYHNSNTSYDGMFIEIQVRTKLEHFWATAVEIIDAATNETLKVGTGRKEYMYFFKLVSGLFSLAENTALVTGIPTDKKSLISEIYRIDKEESIREKLSAYKSAIRFTGKHPQKADYFLLITDMRKSTISAIPFLSSDIKQAMIMYQEVESRKHINHKDVVLVAAKSFEIIRECYPNYFREASDFLHKVNEFCAEYPEKSSISFSASEKGIRVLDYFDVKAYKGNYPDDPILEDGIGAACGNVIICPEWPITLDESYLRYTGIINSYNDINNNRIVLNKVTGPGIIVLQTGASFIVDQESWGFLTPSDSLVIQCKDKTPKEWLLHLIGWIKSNVCTADILCNKHTHSLYRVLDSLFMPSPDDDNTMIVPDIVSKIINREKVFVSSVSQIDDSEKMERIECFNNDIKTLLCELETLYHRYFSLTNNDVDILNQELRLKGYYVYTS